MSIFLDIVDELLEWLPLLLPLLHFSVVAGTLTWILNTKRDATPAVAWCLLVFFLPLLGALIFYIFGYQHVDRPIRRKRRHRRRYQKPPQPVGYPAQMLTAEDERPLGDGGPRTALAPLAARFGAAPVTTGNHVDFYHEGAPAFAAMRAAIAEARDHVHLEFFIWQPDELGRELLALLTDKARHGVEVRLLYDAMGSHRLRWRLLRPLHQAGGKSQPFLPLNPWRRRFQLNLRNHRKILVVDGNVGFVGGLNVGDEYLGKDPHFGYWRDTHLRLRGPAVYDLQLIFCEDWDFAANEKLVDRVESEHRYFRVESADGPYAAQIIASGPDDEKKAIREVTFAAIIRARQRVWIASPYFVPDAALLDALRLAALSGVDVRFLGLFHPDKWFPFYACRYWWAEVLRAGVKVYQYTKGMMHAKVMIVDDDFASVGTANFDNRSMFLNFEVNCLLYSHDAVRELETAFQCDFAESILLDPDVYAERPFAGRILENACRLASPIL
ncbi:MAG: cardiolipin synthase [Gemmataceae bacterium]|nr:cardiolipin synthase [Gemmataceae bacterium]